MEAEDGLVNVKDLLGYEPEEYLESSDFWRTRVHPKDSPRILGDYSRLFAEGHLSIEYRFRKKDGSYCWISDELQMLRNAAGDPIEVVGAWSDITARKQLGEALVAAQDRLVHLLDRLLHTILIPPRRFAEKIAINIFQYHGLVQLPRELCGVVQRVRMRRRVVRR